MKNAKRELGHRQWAIYNTRAFPIKPPAIKTGMKMSSPPCHLNSSGFELSSIIGVTLTAAAILPDTER